MNGKKVIYVQSSLTEDEQRMATEKTKAFCVEEVLKYKDHPKMDVIWQILTSRGDEKLIFGPCPIHNTGDNHGIY